jgi:hypothetical protein
MAAKNDVTGDSIKSRVANKAYRDNWEKIFGKKKSKKKIEGSSKGRTADFDSANRGSNP